MFPKEILIVSPQSSPPRSQPPVPHGGELHPSRNSAQPLQTLAPSLTFGTFPVPPSSLVCTDCDSSSFLLQPNSMTQSQHGPRYRLLPAFGWKSGIFFPSSGPVLTPKCEMT